MLIRIQPGDIPQSIDYIKSTWNKIIPGYPFEYNFLDEVFDRSYRNLERMGNLINGFAVLAVLIACLGLFGLASFIGEQRTKEIGIRKILGSSAHRIVLLLSREFADCEYHCMACCIFYNEAMAVPFCVFY